MKQSLTKRQLKYRIFLYFFALIVATVLLGSMYYSQQQQTFLRHSQEQIATCLEFSVSMVDDMLWDIQNVGLSFFNDSSLRSAMLNARSNGGSLNVSDYFVLKNKLAQVKNILNAKVANVAFYYNDQDLYDGDGGRTRFDIYYNDVRSYDAYDAAYWRSLLENGKRVEFLAVTDVRNEKYDFGRIIPFVMANPEANLPAVMVIDVPIRSVVRILANNVTLDEIMFFVYNEKDECMYADNAELSGQVLRQMNEARKDAYTYVEADSALHDWHFVAVVPSRALLLNGWKSQAGILLSCTLAVACELLIALYATQRLNRPLETIMGFIGDGESHGFLNSLQHVNRRLTHFIEAQNAEKQVIGQFSKAYLDYSFSSILQGQPVRNEKLFFEQVRKYAAFRQGDYQCCALRAVIQPRYLGKIENVEALQTVDRMTQILQNFFQSYPCSYLIEQESFNYFLFWSLDESSNGNLKEAMKCLEELLSSRKEYVSMHVAVGSRRSRLEELNESYAEAILALNRCDEACAFEILFPEKSDRSRRAIIQSIVNHAAEGRTDDALLLLNYALNEKTAKEEIVVQDVYSCLSEYLAAQSAEGGVILHSEITAREKADAAQLRYDLRQLPALLQFASNGKQKKLSELAAAYIHQHFADELYADKIAAELGVQSKLLSSTFRKEMDMSIVDYIMSVRIDYIKNALIYSESKISDIAEKAGFSSRTTFIRVFKNAVGMTPSDYRATYKK